ncbi:MAG: helix-turn-helix domain-containing protein [Proteobacteria bacterium]|nr:helix-turn-helix domain-containing protein [Pseudomonadota bacterium]
MHRVAIVALEGVVPFDLAVPCETFGRTLLADGSPAYEVKVCGLGGTVDTGIFELRPPFDLSPLEHADTIVLPGVADLDRPVPRELVLALRKAAERGARLASVCTGAFVLAATGLLAGRRATTHWLSAAELARRHPAIDVDPSVLFVDNGRLLTSAGAAAAMDLCLHLVRRDHGAAVAAATARIAVMPLVRDGGQAQFIVHPSAVDDGESLAPVLHWIEENAQRPLSLDVIARRAAMSRRTLSRRFREQTGTTPAQWVTQARIRRAQQLLETTAHPIERVADLVGFASASTFRAQFHNTLGTSPQAYRRSFRAR